MHPILRNLSFVLVFQLIFIFISCVDCQLSKNQTLEPITFALKGFKKAKRARPDLLIVYNDENVCGATMFHTLWLMVSYHCIFVRLKMGKAHSARTAGKPFQFRKVLDTDSCGLSCGFAIVKLDHPFMTGPGVTLVGLPRPDMVTKCTKRELLVARVLKPWNDKRSLAIRFKYLQGEPNISQCWAKDNDLFTDEYLCIKMGESDPDGTVCQDVEGKETDKMIIADGPLLCSGYVLGFLNWDSCDAEKNTAGFGNVPKHLDFIKSKTGSRRRSQKGDGDVGTSDGRSLKGSHVGKISIIVTTIFLLFLPCV